MFITMNRIYQGIKVRLRRLYYKIVFKNCGKGLIVDDNVKITWPSMLEAGNNVTINQRVFLQCTPKSSIQLGDGVVMAYDSMILTAGHNLELNPQQHIYKNVVISDHVRILAKALITGGVNIGRRAVIGAGSVVRNDIPPYAIVTGNPAKIIGFISSPDDISEFENSNYDEDNRINIEILENNYNKYFLKRIKDIKDITKL